MHKRPCNRCGNCHIGCLIYAPVGVMVLLVAEVEAAMSYEEDLQQEIASTPLVNWTPRFGRLSRLRDVIGMANSF